MLEINSTLTDSSANKDPVLNQFMDFLARDIATNPESIQAIDTGLINRIQSLVNKTEIDINIPLSTDGE